MSIRGSSSSLQGGGVTRLGPTYWDGLQRSEKTGSKRMLTPSICTRKHALKKETGTSGFVIMLHLEMNGVSYSKENKKTSILSQPGVGDLVSFFRLGSRLTVGCDKVLVDIQDFDGLGHMGGIDLLAVELNCHAHHLEGTMADKGWPRVDEPFAVGFVMGGSGRVC